MSILSIFSGIGYVLFSILVFVVIVVFLVIGGNDLGSGLTRPATGTTFWGRFRHWMRGAGWQGWLIAIIVAAVVAGSGLFVLAAKPGTWALISWVLVLAALVYVMHDWYRRSGTLRTRKYWLSWVLFLTGMVPGVVVFLLASGEVSNSVVWMTASKILVVEMLCIFGILFIQRNMVATNDPRWRKAKAYAIFIAILVAVVFIIANINWGGTSDKVVVPTEAQVVPTETQLAPTDAQVSIGDGRDPRFIQEEIPHENYRFVANFSERLKKNSGDTTATVLEASGHDAELLAIYARVLGIRETSQYGELLTPDGTYLSDEGIILYHQLEGVLLSCETKRIEVPSSGTNTGYNSGLNVAEEPGISGDRNGTEYTTLSGDVFYILDRCGNYVYPTDPPEDIPVGPTDEVYNKDPTLGVKVGGDGEYHADSPGTNTNDGVGATSSAADSSTNSGSMTVTEYSEAMEEHEGVSTGQQVGGDPNTSSTPTPTGANVDNNGDNGTGNGGIDEPTPTTPPESEIATDPVGSEWGGPPD